MASTAIVGALKVLGAALANQLATLITSQTPELFLTLSDLKISMNNISSELRVMQAFIEEIDMNNQRNKTRLAWIGEVQKIANCIKDVMDEFVYLVDNKKLGGMWFYARRIFKDRKSLANIKRVASQLHIIERNLEHLARIKDRWVPSNLGILENSNHSIESAQHLAFSAHYIDEGGIVGAEEYRLKLTSWLYSGKQSLTVITVWGMGGIGKTTLVTNVFNKEKVNFDCHAWISISQNYRPDNLLRNLISEICKSEKTAPINNTTMDIRELKETTMDLLIEKKYLIVLDDAWDTTICQDLYNLLISSHQRSRIVITSRVAQLAFLAQENNRLELKPLSDYESWNLFCKKAFHWEENHACPPLLEKWAREIVSRCDGLPLALVSIGSVLSLCEKTESEWKRVNDQLTWELDNNPRFDHLRNILYLSFNYLPRYLKNCFLYCCMFPEDYLLSRKILITLWVAEGFVEERGGSTLEEVADGYLIQLVNRSMLQVVSRNHFGRVRKCRMHDTLRELAISLCMKENFSRLHEDNKPAIFDMYTRRLSVIKFSKEIGYDIHLPQLRAFISFDPCILSSHLLTSIFSNSKYLTVLYLHGLPIKTVPDAIGDLFNLHYLCLRDTMVECLPNSIKELHNLQTLELRGSKIEKLPEFINNLKRLRHLFAEIVINNSLRSFRCFNGILLPKGMSCLKELRTLRAVESNSLVVNELENLTQLRTFRILNVKEHHWTDLCASLSKMLLLSHLVITACHQDEFLQLDHLTHPPPQPQKLGLIGRLKIEMLESPIFKSSGNYIHVLWLGWSQLSEDPLPSLSRLRNLTYLSLKRAYDGHQLVFQAGWFPKLKCLELVYMPNLVRVDMERDTMVCLEDITLTDLEQLAEIPMGIEHISSLKNMFCRQLSMNYGGLATGRHKLWNFYCYVTEPRPHQVYFLQCFHFVTMICVQNYCSSLNNFDRSQIAHLIICVFFCSRRIAYYEICIK
jgi:disease resistance protein RPM1